jgi:hypothetical protein
MAFTTIDVEQVTLDQELSKEARIGLIKIDCEGFEYRVLQGARRILADHRPALFVELHPEMIRRAGDAPEDVCALLRDSGYAVECWNVQRSRHGWLVPRVLNRYRTSRVHRYRDMADMLSDLPVSRPEQVYLVATPQERQARP